MLSVECGATKEDTRLHVDHIIPVSQGGTDELSNFQTLCEACNLAKSNRAWVAGKYKKTTTITEEYQSRKKIDYSIMAEEARKKRIAMEEKGYVREWFAQKEIRPNFKGFYEPQRRLM